MRERFFRLLLGGLAFAVALYLIAANFSEVETKYSCVGELSASGDSEATTVYFALKEYRWWVSLWSDGKGSVFLEIPNRIVRYFDRIEGGEFEMQIFITYPTELKGTFSKLSKTLAIDAGIGFFEGKCSKMP